MTNRKTSPLIEPHAIDIARAALEEVGEGGVGKHIGVAEMGAHVATHRFAADVPGYPGWEWQAVLACAAGSRRVTVNEVALVPGGQALRPPNWVPYSQRLRPGDLGPGDLMPPTSDDDRLERGELSPSGLAAAQERWRQEYGPNSDMASQAPLQCKTCAFFLPFLPNFGVCANEYSADGRAVHATYGCGAHSGLKLKEDLRPSNSAFDDEKPIY